MKYLLLLSVPLSLKVISHGVQRPEDGVHAILAGRQIARTRGNKIKKKKKELQLKVCEFLQFPLTVLNMQLVDQVIWLLLIDHRCECECE